MNMLYLDSLILIKYLEKIMILVEFYIHKCKFSGKKTQFFFFLLYFTKFLKIVWRNWLLKTCLKTFDYILPNLELIVLSP